MSFFSIIVPVFNAEKTLARCLDSVCSQSFSDYEAILIDDGSTDRSASICAEFCQKNSRIQYVCQENQGPSAARNRGMELAKGRFFCFVDSDDYISGDYLSKLYDYLCESGAETVFFGYYSVNADGKTTAHIPTAGVDSAALPAVLSEKDMFGYTWIKCFSSDVVGEKRFPEDMSLFEDEVFSCDVLKKERRIGVLPEPIYYYSTSEEKALSKQVHKDYCTLSDRVFSAWEGMPIGPGREEFLQRKANAFVSRCVYYGLEQNVETRDFFRSLRETRFFDIHTNLTTLDRYIRKGNWPVVEAAITIYRLKNKLAKAKRISNE